jgi:hypothetical protein
VPRCIAYGIKLGGLRKGSGREATNYEQIIFASPVLLLLETGKCINAASHNADYTRVEGIKRVILLGWTLQQSAKKPMHI